MINDKSNNVDKNLDNIVNNSHKNKRPGKYRKYMLTGGALATMGLGSALAQNADTDTTYASIDSRFTQETPYHVVKAGTPFSFNDGRDPNGVTYFLVRADYERFMKALMSGNAINMNDGQATQLYDLMEDIKNTSIFDKIGMMNSVDGEQISKVVSQQLGRSERIKGRDRLTTTDGEWDAEETAQIGNIMKTKGYDRMWMVVIRQGEGMDPVADRYNKFAEPYLILFDAENYNGQITRAKTPEELKDKGKGTLYISPEAVHFYAGLGVGQTKNIGPDKNTTLVPQARIGFTTPFINLGIRGGYADYMKSFFNDYPNEQDNGWTKIYGKDNIQVKQFGPEIGFNVSKNIELCLGGLNNLVYINRKDTTEQKNINPFNEDIRYFKVTSESDTKDSYWTINPGVRMHFRWFGLGLDARYDVERKRFEGVQADISFYPHYDKKGRGRK